MALIYDNERKGHDWGKTLWSVAAFGIAGSVTMLTLFWKDFDFFHGSFALRQLFTTSISIGITSIVGIGYLTFRRVIRTIELLPEEDQVRITIDRSIRGRKIITMPLSKMKVKSSSKGTGDLSFAALKLKHGRDVISLKSTMKGMTFDSMNALTNQIKTSQLASKNYLRAPDENFFE